MRRSYVLLLLAFCLTLGLAAKERDLVRYANTLQGTNSNFALSRGNTFPATAMPYGVHEWTPQTGKNGDGFKYLYEQDEIRGFGQSHQCSPWVSDYAVYTLMPEVGELVLDAEKRGAKFSHTNESGQPHYYTVRFDNGIRTEMAPTDRGVHLRFAYPKQGDAYLVLDGYIDQSEIHIDPTTREVRGWVNNQRFVNHSDNFRCYFILQFDTPFADYGTWENQQFTRQERHTDAEGKGVGAYLRFRAGAKVQVKAASSYISLDQARTTLEAELGKDKTLEATKQRGHDTWNALFHRVEVEGDNEDDLRTFYSCLFRANLFSRKFYELAGDGKPYYYSPYDGKIYQGYMFTDNGLWDTFRSQFPLTNILHPTQQGRYMQALLDAQKQFGWLPSWSFPGETGGMLGNHAISLLTDAWMKGVRTFDPDSALAAYAHEVFNKGPLGAANGRQCWKEYFQLGYVPFPESHGCVSQTLEYAYDDFCAWQLARSCGNRFYEEIFARHMYNYRNLWDPSTRFMRGRGMDGRWQEPFDPLAWGGPYTEGNAWHYVWSVFHDVQGLINLFGSDEAFVSKMDSVFSQEPIVHEGWYPYHIHEMKEMEIAGMGQYAHGNQPIQHMPYLYCYAGQPWKTQYWVRQIMSRLYSGTENGFPGDEDQGGMSSWYVLSALGLYAVCPGTDQYVIGSPLFRRTTITLENGNRFTIEAEQNSSTNVYIQQATLNGQPLERNYITYSEIAQGGTLHFLMGPTPNKKRATSKAAAPFSLSQ